MSAKIIITGNLTRDPVMRDAKGVSLLTFSVGVRTFSRDENGEYISNFYDASTRRNADFLASNMKKGMRVQVIGDLILRSYKDKNGNDRSGLQINNAEVEIMERIENAAPVSRPAPSSVVEEDDELPI